MQAKDLMTTPVVTIDTEATAAQAAELMMRRGIGSLLVVDAAGHLCGILTQDDFLPHRRFLPLSDPLYTLMGSWTTPDHLEENSRVLQNKKVGKVCNPQITTIQEDAPVAEVAKLMLRKDLRYLAVMRGSEVRGIITRRHLLKLTVESEQPSSIEGQSKTGQSS